jgi:hypothetical protein
MIHVLVRHTVRDYAVWKRVFDNFFDNRVAGGELRWRISRMVDDPNSLVLDFDWDSAENARRFFDSPPLKAEMMQAGVVEPPEIYFLEEVAKGETRREPVMP